MTQSKRILRNISIALVLLAALAIGAFHFLSGSQYFSLDINPSVEIKTNRLHRVVNLRPLNQDATTLLAGYRSSGKSLDTVIEDLVDRMILSGSLGGDKPNDILITVQDHSTSQQTLAQVNQEIADYLTYRNVEATIYSQTAAWDQSTNEKAEAAGVSPGKVSLVQQLTQDPAQEEALVQQEISQIMEYAAVQNITLDSLATTKEATQELPQRPAEEQEVPARSEEDIDDEIQENSFVENSSDSAVETLDAESAKEIFASYFPGVPVQKVELQDGGKKYYLYGEQNGTHYKMNVLIDGTVVYHSPTKIDDPSPSLSSESSETTGGVASETSPFSQSKVEEIFASYFPGVPIQKVELQDGGKKYYLYGEQNGTHYKMNVLIDGTVVYHSPTNIDDPSPSLSSENSEATGEVASETSPFSQSKAEEIFVNTFGVSPQTVELQDGGKNYYMYAYAGGVHYKMKVSASDGTVLFSNSGGQGNRSQRGRQSYRRNG